MNRRAFWTGIVAWLTGTAAVFVGLVLLAEPSPAERYRQECQREYDWQLSTGDPTPGWDEVTAAKAALDACLARVTTVTGSRD